MDDISKTLYIPLAARIYISKKFPEFFYDKIALKLENNKNLPPCKEYAGFASVARTKIFDEQAEIFAKKFNEKVAIIHLGAGLDTQNYRLEHLKNAHFYNIDFPEVIDLRRELLGISENETLIAQDFFNFSWKKEIKEEQVLFIASGVFQYLNESKIMWLFNILRKFFPQARIIFDATTKLGIKLANLFVKTNSKIKNAQMDFYINDLGYFLKITETKLILELPFFGEVRKIKNLNLSTRFSMYLADKYRMAKIIILEL